MNRVYDSEHPEERAKSAARTLDVLEVISRHPAGLTFTQIARETAIAKATLHHILSLLAARGYLLRDPERKVFTPGVRLFEVGTSFLKGSTVLTAAMPVLNEVNQLTGELTSLGVREGTQVVIVHRLPSTHAVSINIDVGSRWPAHCTAQGLAFLAALSDEEIKELYPNEELELHTPVSVRTVTQLRARLAQVRSEGVSIVKGEVIVGETSVGSSILSPEGRPLAAVSIAVPGSRGTEAYLRRLARLIRASTAGISLRMGRLAAAPDALPLARVWSETPELENA